MELTNLLVGKIKQLRSITTKQQRNARDPGDQRELKGYLKALDDVSAMIRQGKDVYRLEQQLARKRGQWEQDPEPDWSHLSPAAAPATENRAVPGQTAQMQRGREGAPALVSQAA